MEERTMVENHKARRPSQRIKKQYCQKEIWIAKRLGEKIIKWVFLEMSYSAINFPSLRSVLMVVFIEILLKYIENKRGKFSNVPVLFLALCLLYMLIRCLKKNKHFEIYLSIPNLKHRDLKTDNIMADKLRYIPNDDSQNFSYGRV